MKTIRFSLILSGNKEAIVSIRWYVGTTLCHYSEKDIHIDTLSPGKYYVSVAAQQLEGTQLTVLIDDVTDIMAPQNIFTQFSDKVDTSIHQPYVVIK